MYFYRRLKDTREDLDISQGQAAETLQIKQAQLSRYENGVNEIPLHYIIALADLYKVSIDYLVGRTDKKALNIDTDTESKKSCVSD